MQNTTRKEVRQAFKSAGYSVSFKRNPFNSDICSLAWRNPDMLRPVDGNVFSAEFYSQHKIAFDLANSFKQVYLTDTDQKIV